MVLNRNVTQFFNETEQVAMAPSNLVPGIEPSEDRLLQGRLFSYADTQMYRLGANGTSLPVNRPRNAVSNGNQDGAMNSRIEDNQGVNYQPSRLYPREEVASVRYSHSPLSGETQQQGIAKTQNFKQAGELFRSFDAKAQRDLIQSLGGALSRADAASREMMLAYFYKADKNYGERLAAVTGDDVQKVKALADKLAE
jgi:catalase